MGSERTYAKSSLFPRRYEIGFGFSPNLIIFKQIVVVVFFA
jgi:hypothetical protein